MVFHSKSFFGDWQYFSKNELCENLLTIYNMMEIMQSLRRWYGLPLEGPQRTNVQTFSSHVTFKCDEKWIYDPVLLQQWHYQVLHHVVFKWKQCHLELALQSVTGFTVICNICFKCIFIEQILNLTPYWFYSSFFNKRWIWSIQAYRGSCSVGITVAKYFKAENRNECFLLDQ
jgi:hypothetical protein